MSLEMVFNELSLQTQAPSREVAYQWMINLVDTVRVATDDYGVDDILRVHSQVYNILLAPNYSVWNWLVDPIVELEIRQRIISLVSKVPFIDDLQDPKLENEILLTDFYYQRDKALSLGVAYLLGALAISVRSQEKWHPHRIELNASKLEDDGTLKLTAIQVVHASRVEHIQQHNDWITERLKADVRDGIDLWERRGKLLPNLAFCENVKKQVYDLKSGNRLLYSVVRQLFEFEKYCKTWTHGPFDKNQLPGNCSGESEITLAQYSQERTFLCPDGEWRLFELHAKLGLNYWRIHFLPQPQSNTIIVGYIGPHLPTARG